MPNEFIEVTPVMVIGTGVGAPTKRVLGTRQIVSVGPGTHNTTLITLVGEETLNVQETYEDMKRLLGV
jgi:hypothetical protein